MWHCMTKHLWCAKILHHQVYSCLTLEDSYWRYCGAPIWAFWEVSWRSTIIFNNWKLHIAISASVVDLFIIKSLWSTFILWLKLSTEWCISNFKSSPTTAAMLIVSPWFGNIWENGQAIWFIWFMSLQLLSVELEEPWCYMSINNIICVWNTDIYIPRGPL